MAWLAKMCISPAEPLCYRAAEFAFVFNKLHAVRLTILYSTKKVPLHHLACNQIHTRFLSFHGYCSLMQSIASLQPSPAESRGSHTLFFHRLVCCAWEGNGTLTLVPISLWTLETSRQWMNTNESYLLKNLLICWINLNTKQIRK